MNTRLKGLTRICCIVSALVLFYIISLPIWRIELAAPQYPDGLNHYIGMRTLHTEDFIEFAILPYIIGALALFGILTAIINRKWFFFSWIGFLCLFGIIALVDFYRWNYNYGHNLNPEAPIQVPGMSYQPPLIGYKQLLNFGAYSIPDVGGWIFIGIYILLLSALFFEIRAVIKLKGSVHPAFAITMLCLFFVSCTAAPRPIKSGKDACEYCKMTITDPRFAAELITSTGKLFVFDDLHCLKGYYAEHTAKLKDASFYVVDFVSGELVPSNEVQLVQSEKAHSPMGSNTIAFKNVTDQQQYLQSNSGVPVNWKAIIKRDKLSRSRWRKKIRDIIFKSRWHNNRRIPYSTWRLFKL